MPLKNIFFYKSNSLFWVLILLMTSKCSVKNGNPVPLRVNCKMIQENFTRRAVTNINLFDPSIDKPVEYSIADVFMLQLNSVKQISDGLIESSFVLLQNKDTVYDIGLVSRKIWDIGYCGRCDNTTRYIFNDTTFQLPHDSDVYCTKYITSNDNGNGVNFDFCRIKNGRYVLSIAAKENNLGIDFLDFEFDSSNVLSAIEWETRHLQNTQ